MLPDLSPAHILIVVVVALIVVGPKDLPLLLRKIGQFMGKMRGMANEFRASFDEMARQSELDELRKEVEAMRAAANAATPDLGLNADLGLNDALKSDSESAYLTDWQASQAAAQAPAAEPTILPPAQADAAKPVKISKSKAASPKTKSAKTAEPGGKAAPKSKAPASSKGRAKKAKPAAEAGS